MLVLMCLYVFCLAICSTFKIIGGYYVSFNVCLYVFLFGNMLHRVRPFL